MSKRLKFFLLALFAILLFTAGCSKITKESYDKLEIGMGYSEISALLGNPNGCAESIGLKSCIWGNETQNIKVNFLGDQILVLSSSGLK